MVMLASLCHELLVSNVQVLFMAFTVDIGYREIII